MEFFVVLLYAFFASYGQLYFEFIFTPRHLI